MKTIDFVIHDSEIIEVIEKPQTDTLDFILNYPENWEKKIYRKKILRFYNILNYRIYEIPFDSCPTILEQKNLGEINYSLGEGRNEIKVKRQKVELITNAGKRTLEYEKLELIDY
jgi:hypothetical protein